MTTTLPGTHGPVPDCLTGLPAYSPKNGSLRIGTYISPTIVHHPGLRRDGMTFQRNPSVIFLSAERASSRERKSGPVLICMSSSRIWCVAKILSKHLATPQHERIDPIGRRINFGSCQIIAFKRYTQRMVSAMPAHQRNLGKANSRNDDIKSHHRAFDKSPSLTITMPVAVVLAAKMRVGLKSILPVVGTVTITGPGLPGKAIDIVPVFPPTQIQSGTNGQYPVSLGVYANTVCGVPRTAGGAGPVRAIATYGLQYQSAPLLKQTAPTPAALDKVAPPLTVVPVAAVR